MKPLKRIRALRSRLADIASGLALAEAKAKKFHRQMHVLGDHPVAWRRSRARYKYWTAKQSAAYARRHHLRVLLRRLLKKLARKEPIIIGHGASLRVFGGTAEEKLHRAFTFARKHWHDYYSEEGGYDEGWSLTNGHHQGRRRDCSWLSIEIRRACGLPTIDSEPRFTGSCLTFGREVSRHYAETHTGVWVVFGSGDGFHMGTSTGTGPFIDEHGREQLDIGHFDEFGPGTEVRYRAVDD